MKVSVDGAELHYSVLGRGPTCLVLTAVGTKPYIRMTSALSGRLQLAYVDLRGGGQSTGNASDLTFDVLSSDLEAIQADLGVEHVVVLGHSVLGILAIEHEGTQVCDYLTSQGVTAILLKYRVPARDKANPSKEPLQDAQRAMGLVRHHAAEWGIKPDRIGILGFSAGGHLTVMASLHPNQRTYTQDPALDVADAAPNFAVPVYPAYLVPSKDETFTLKPEIAVTEKSPPMCLIHAGDDKGITSASGSALLYLEYKKLNLPAELHIYAKGGHGFGMKQSGLPTADWLVRVAEWIKSMGW